MKTVMNHEMGIVNFVLVFCGKQDLVHSLFPLPLIDATSKNRVKNFDK